MRNLSAGEIDQINGQIQNDLSRKPDPFHPTLGYVSRMHSKKTKRRAIAFRDPRPDEPINKRDSLPDDEREMALRRLAESTAELNWSRRLMHILLEELGTLEDVERLIGRLAILPPARYPQAAALAVALRYSWRRDEFQKVSRQFRLLPAKGRRGRSN